MNPRTLLRLTPFLDEGRHTPEELAEKSGLGELIVQETLHRMAANGIGRLDDGAVIFRRGDKIACALLAVQLGCGVEESSKCIGWRDFEDLVAEMLSAEGYTVKRNLRLRKPRAEIDILADRNGVGFAIDCKQWRRTVGAASMRRVVEMQIARAEHLMKDGGAETLRLRSLYPVIATLYEEDVRTISGVPIVPVTRFGGFLREFEGCTENLRDVCRPEAGEASTT